jgi:DNA-binding HxlR family transcriptional regulator
MQLETRRRGKSTGGNLCQSSCGLATPSIAEILQLVGGGAGGPALLALGRGPRRTQELTREVRHYAPRTVYRHAAKLIEYGLVEREEEDVIPSAVTYRLTRPAGVDFYRLLDSFAATWLPRSPEGQLEGESWAALAVLGELWEMGAVTALSQEPRSAAQLIEASPGLNSEQVARRTRKFVASRLLESALRAGQGKFFSLTAEARRGMALIAAVGRWRFRHLDVPEDAPFTLAESATLLGAMLPLIELPKHNEISMAFCIDALADELVEEDGEVVGAQLDTDGSVRYVTAAVAVADGWARGTVSAWLAALLDGNRRRLRRNGASDVVDACLQEIHQKLIEASSPVRPQELN